MECSYCKDTRVVITDLKQPIVQTGLIVGLSANVSSYNNYYAFGMLQSGRNYVGSNGYRYGFNNVDPITHQYPELTPYQFASNMPINSIDLDGLEGMLAFILNFNFAQPQFKVMKDDKVITLTSQHWVFGLANVSAGYINKDPNQVFNKDYSAGTNLTLDPRAKTITFSVFNKFSKDNPYGLEGFNKTKTNFL